jgi:mannose-6-phosphate isomerase class I
MKHQYEKEPSVAVSAAAGVSRGWRDIADRVRAEFGRGIRHVAIECYPGVVETEIAEALAEAVAGLRLFRTDSALLQPAEINSLTARDLTDDPVFGRLSGMRISEFFDQQLLNNISRQVASSPRPTIVLGTGAILASPTADLLIYADMPRWEIQMRQRSGKIGNLAANNEQDRPALKYKRAFFLDWRAADRLKREVWARIDYLLDTTVSDDPKMVTGSDYRNALSAVASRPFRVKPFFDPGPWGGQWMRRVCNLPKDPPNYAWCFDCVPEENSLLLDFGQTVMETPSINLVFQHPRELLGDAVHARFGTEFPIRFDFLDTMDGGNLSLQVHPLTEYIQDHFGMHYTQDESYYLLDAGPDACVYLGLKEGIDRQQMCKELRKSQSGQGAFDAGQYVNKWSAKKHDHFLIPAGTIHCSGRNGMVLEISATPFIFTFKLWDWGRVGLDGRPRPIHLDHGMANIQWDRDRQWVERNLINRVRTIRDGAVCLEEATGLHEREFIETRRHWFTSVVSHETNGGVHVLNLVEGESVIVASPTHAFEPQTIHYAETFIVPAAVGAYTISPQPAGQRSATMRASVRTSAHDV